MERAALLIGTRADFSSIGGVAADGTVIRTLEWELAGSEALAARAEAVFVAISTPVVPHSARFFARLAAGQIDRAVLAVVRPEDEAFRHADDFVVWPVDADELRHRLQRLMVVADRETVDARALLVEEHALAQLAGHDAAFVDAIRQIPTFARSGMPVLIVGETGTGKELCARALHAAGPRRHESFIAVDCSAIPDHLFENELFGHLRGAYTDAHSEQKGLAALAGRGTLLLDEIDSLSLAAQGKLLRFLQEKTYRPLGGEKFLPAHAVVIAAANRDLGEAVREKCFRSDLYYRINVLRIALPPLRQRGGDVVLLARKFLLAACAQLGMEIRWSPAALRKLEAYDWPGNVRELWNIVQRAAIGARVGAILPMHVDTPATPCADGGCETFRTARTRAIQLFERAWLADVLASHGGNISRAARATGQERRAFGRLVKKYALKNR